MQINRNRTHTQTTAAGKRLRAAREDRGLALVDVLFGMAIFALVVVIAVMGYGMFRQKAYQTAVTADAERLGVALLAGDFEDKGGQTSPAAWHENGMRTSAGDLNLASAAVKGGRLAHARTMDISEVTDPLEATGITLYKNSYVQGWSVNNRGQFSFCIEHVNPGGEPDAWAAYDSDRGGIVGSGTPGGCSDYADLHDYNPAPVDPVLPTNPTSPSTPETTTPSNPSSPSPTTPSNPSTPTPTTPSNPSTTAPPACTVSTNYDNMEPGTTVSTIKFPGTSTTAKMTFAPSTSSDISGSGTISQISGGGTKYVRTNMNDPLRSGRYVDVTIKFSAPVKGLQAKIHDIDRSGSAQSPQWVDQVLIGTSGYTVSSRGQNVSGSGTSASPFYNSVWGDNPIASGKGDVTVKWSESVSQVLIRFRSGANGSSQNQQIGIGALSFTDCS